MTNTKLIDTDFVLKMFDADQEKAEKSFIQFCETVSDDQCLEMENKRMISDTEAKEIIKSVCQIINASDLQKMDAQRNHYLKQLREEYRLSIRQIERLTGINRGIISRA